MEFRLIHATDDVRLIIKIANRCLRRMFRSGYYYKKAGVCLEDLILNDPVIIIKKSIIKQGCYKL